MRHVGMHMIGISWEKSISFSQLKVLHDSYMKVKLWPNFKISAIPFETQNKKQKFCSNITEQGLQH